MRPDGPSILCVGCDMPVPQDDDGKIQEVCEVCFLTIMLDETRRALRALVTTIESCDLSVVDEILVGPFVQRAKEQIADV